MAGITEMMDMLDWHMPPKIQAKGRALAKSIETIAPFIQPQTPKHDKNVWENCAVIIADESDEKLKPHLIELPEWLQDMSWPGAFCIQGRLLRYADNHSIHSAVSTCVEKAKDCKDEVWESNLLTLLHMRS